MSEENSDNEIEIKRGIISEEIKDDKKEDKNIITSEENKDNKNEDKNEKNLNQNDNNIIINEIKIEEVKQDEDCNYSYIIGEITIKKEDINKQIQIINSFENIDKSGWKIR